MKLFKNSVCLVLTAPEMFLRIESLLKNRYSLVCKTDVYGAISFMRNQLIECIIIQADDRFIISSVELLRLRTQFPMIPTIIIIKDQNLKFARLCGELGVEYVISILKLRYAMHLMKNSGLRINEIGRLVGYSDPRRFNECFHRILGIAPVECRKRVMSENINDII